MAPSTAYIGLGSNLGDRHANINSALKNLADHQDITLCRVSDIQCTQPLGPPDQPDYLNAVAELETTLSPHALLAVLLQIEKKLGRVRREPWSARTIDLDLLLFDQQVITGPDLTVPHPRMHLRSFVLQGLCQLNPDLIHPLLDEPVHELARRLAGRNFALNPQLPQLVSIAGNIGVGKTTLAHRLSQMLGADLILEPYDKNPFLPHVYAGRHELALDSQLYFLTERFRQLDAETLQKGRLFISDYIFEKETIYADRLLDPQQRRLYQQVYQLVAAKLTPPSLVIYLHDSPQACLQRIRARNRPYEQKIQLSFLQQLDQDYQALFARWDRCPLIRLRTPQLDYTDERALQRIASQIKMYIALADSDEITYPSKDTRSREHGASHHH